MDLETAAEKLSLYIKDKNLRNTPERFNILKAIFKTDDHFDAEELFMSLKKKERKISFATVYNTLDLLVKCGIISKYRFGSDHFRYEKSFGKPRHHHLICLQCGDIIEFISNELSETEKKISIQKKFTIKNSTLQIFGTCNNCR